MNLHQLGYLVAVIDHGSVTAAASHLHLTQPALSRQIRSLERQLGTDLFVREGRQLRLTPAGRAFLPHARALLARADEVRRAADVIAAGRLETLYLAVPTTTLTDVVAPFVAAMDAQAPMPIVRELDPLGAEAALQSGADLAIVTSPPPRTLAARPLAVLPVWAYVRSQDEWAGRGEVSVAELVRRDLVLLTDRFRPRQLLDRMVEDAGLSYAAVSECTNAQIAQSLAAAGRGVAVVSDDPRFGLVPLAVHRGRIRLEIHLYAAWNPAHHAAAAVAGFAQSISDFCLTRYGEQVRPGRRRSSADA